MEEESKISQGLDYYKATMGMNEFLKHPEAEVTFTLKNRSPNLLSEFVTSEELRNRLSELSDGWRPDEIAYLASLQNQDGKAQFSPEYLDFLMENPLPPVDINYDEHGDLSVSSTGKWPLVTFWETVIMSEINEIYFKNKLTSEGRSLAELYAEGDRRLSEKIALLKDLPYIKFSDFGTRRRFSYDWHRHVVERVATELPDNFVGTSNIYLAHKLGLKPIGTFAHEMPMVYAALADKGGNNPLDGHNQALQDWQNTYGNDLSIALTDTFTTDFFFAYFTPEQMDSWKGLRHDSGDPIDFGNKAIEVYQKNGIDPMEKTIVFSDGLDADEIIRLADYFKGRINVTFGWGTTLTNDLGIKPNNFVMKATEVDGISTVKLSDTPGKHTGTIDKISEYKQRVKEALAKKALSDSLLVAV
ncbi:nicotinate phosphoribosyltransferase [Candidatus Nanosynbacter sp. TM7-074]|uniref:Nicotinate phosphoribosyltransferase n=1 Tax=Candidatus Nanosynbacter sp. TM7-074 TaxID=3158573 RepID=A0AB39JAA4_9BACT